MRVRPRLLTNHSTDVTRIGIQQEQLGFRDCLAGVTVRLQKRDAFKCEHIGVLV